MEIDFPLLSPEAPSEVHLHNHRSLSASSSVCAAVSSVFVADLSVFAANSSICSLICRRTANLKLKKEVVVYRRVVQKRGLRQSIHMTLALQNQNLKHKFLDCSLSVVKAACS